MKLECFEVWIRGWRTGLKGNISKIQGPARKRTLIEHGHGSWALAVWVPGHVSTRSPQVWAHSRGRGASPSSGSPSCVPRCELCWEASTQGTNSPAFWAWTQLKDSDSIWWPSTLGQTDKSHPALLLSIVRCTLVWPGSREPSRKLLCIKL